MPLASESGISYEDADLSKLTAEDEYAVVRALADFKDSVKKAAESNEPFMVARQVALIARNFNRFYNNSSILNAEDGEIRKSRLALCEACCDTVKSGLNLLGIDVVERM